MKFRDGISIIVTVYNKEQFISKTLDAITQQMEKTLNLLLSMTDQQISQN